MANQDNNCQKYRQTLNEAFDESPYRMTSEKEGL